MVLEDTCSWENPFQNRSDAVSTYFCFPLLFAQSWRQHILKEMKRRNSPQNIIKKYKPDMT